MSVTPTPSVTPTLTVTPTQSPTVTPTNTYTPTQTPTQSAPIVTTVSLFTSIRESGSFTGFTSMGDITTVNEAVCTQLDDTSRYSYGGSLYKINTSSLQVGSVIRRNTDNFLVQNSILIRQIQQGPTQVGSDYWFIQTDINGVVTSYQQMNNC